MNDGGGGKSLQKGVRGEICLFLSKNKNMQIISQNPLTILDLCGKIVNCIIIALIMGTSAFEKGIVPMQGDFSRSSLCRSTNGGNARFPRLRPWHLPCPWVVRLTHEVPDVRVTAVRRPVRRSLAPIPRRRSGIRPTVSTNVFEWSV